MHYTDQEKYQRAKKRVEEIKGFYGHLLVYLAINLIILINIGLNTNNFWRWYNFITPIFWGLGLLLHWINAFGRNPFFGKTWEEREVKQLMQQDQENANKF